MANTDRERPRGEKDKGQAGAHGSGKAAGLGEKARDAASGALGKARDVASAAGGAVRDAASDVTAGVGDAATAVREKAGEVADTLVSMVRRNPIPALLVGVGIGFLLGRTLGGR